MRIDCKFIPLPHGILSCFVMQYSLNKFSGEFLAVPGKIAVYRIQLSIRFLATPSCRGGEGDRLKWVATRFAGDV